METLTIEYQPHVKAELMNFLNTFEKKDLQVMIESKSHENDPEFIAYRDRLHDTVKRIENGECKMYDIDELDAMLEKSLSKYEN